MTAVEIKQIVMLALMVIILAVSCIPGCILISYKDFSKAQFLLKLYMAIYLGVTIAITLYLASQRTPDVYLGM